MSLVIDCTEKTRPFGSQNNWKTIQFSTQDQGDRITREVKQLMEIAGYSDRSVFAMTTSLIEAIVNAIKHGHKFDPSKTVEVRYQINATRTVVEVEDEGQGFDHEAVPDPTAPENLDRPSGRGVMMMHNFLSWVEFNERGNCVTLCEYFDSDE